ncbi:unnamed protein product [Cuscuta epithymum]|uniref:Uncharacterized protein n=1 Tax=Cuscuta epithymum TaxID=186058 RepID=A0AAV0DQ73_9ASTE|nr:unnamed protein product [Cuscuta epithymum]CAH9128861.1 unnamed protein product [Cuscuta epithymum]
MPKLVLSRLQAINIPCQVRFRPLGSKDSTSFQPKGFSSLNRSPYSRTVIIPRSVYQAKHPRRGDPDDQTPPDRSGQAGTPPEQQGSSLLAFGRSARLFPRLGFYSLRKIYHEGDTSGWPLFKGQHRMRIFVKYPKPEKFG